MKNALLLFLICLPLIGYSQYAGGDIDEPFSYSIKKASIPVVLDGSMGINEWEGHKTVSDFNNHWPNDEGLADNQTEVRVAYDDANIYVLVAEEYRKLLYLKIIFLL